MSKNYSWDKCLSDSDQIPIEDESKSNPGSKAGITCNSPTDEFQEILSKISPDQAEHVWHVVGVCVYQEIGGLKGLSIFDEWYRRSVSYPGYENVVEAYNSFSDHQKHLIDKDALLSLFVQDTIDLKQDIPDKNDEFTKCEFGIITPPEPPAATNAPIKPFIFDSFSLTGKSDILEAEQLEQVFILEPIARRGESTVLFGAPNSGKTLITISLLLESVHCGRIDPGNAYYLDHDDPHHAIIEKLHIFEEAGIHLLADGYQGLNASKFPQQIDEACKLDQVHGKILIIDTLKKQVDVMNKRESAEWGRRIRKVTAKGGSVLSLGHVNKKLDAQGKPIFSGVADFVDDCDTAYVMRTIEVDEKTQIATVEFENIKRRSDVAARVGFRFSVETGISYQERLASVERIDDENLDKIKVEEAQKSDAELIDIVVRCIGEGINSKMRLRDAISVRASISKRAAIRLIEKYEGDDPEIHEWSQTVQERGRKVYSILKGESDE
jgi:hypothetical protein